MDERWIESASREFRRFQTHDAREGVEHEWIARVARRWYTRRLAA